MPINPKYFCLITAIAATALFAQKPKVVKPVPPLTIEKGKFTYVPDSLGDRIPDYSYCGYMASEKPIPMVPVKMVVPAQKGDATNRIQSALDYVAALPIGSDGFRGAVLLGKGSFEVLGQLKLNASGVVLRGSGMGANGTTIIGAGTDRQTLIRFVGKNDKKANTEIKIADNYVPVNAMKLNVDNASSFKTGDKITIRRPSTKEWIEAMNMVSFGGGISSLGWKEGDEDVFFDRTITAVDGNAVSIDAPLTCALDAKYGGGFISSYQWNGRINNVGVENLKLISTFDEKNAKDEAHRWMAITMDNTENAWVRQVIFQHFAGSAVQVLETSKCVTVEDCKYLAPVSEIGGQRRYAFFTRGQQTLFQRCYSEFAYHDFSTGYCAPGPNAFVLCESHLPYSFSGGIDSWATGVLMDVVYIDGNGIRFANREQDGRGAGWAAANSLYWNCSAGKIDCYKPPTAQNWSFGSWAQFGGDGYWSGSNDAMQPRSFYYTQLAQRLNKNVDAQSQLLKVETEASSSPTVAVAKALTDASVKPHIQLTEWIDQAAQRNPIDVDAKGAKTIDAIGITKTISPILAPAMHIQNGWIARGNNIMVGRRVEVPWWTGGVEGKDLSQAQLAITRFVPGRTGKGLTDDLDEMTDELKNRHVVGLEQHYALWYDRRRDDHERIRRIDGEVWPPFYEVPFARTGIDFAWDGLSKYDITKYNLWYWSRTKQYADLADQKGLLLVNQNFFQHNIIEAGAHYVDFPWRTANNINGTGFPEPPPFAGDKRIFLGEQFYDETNPARRENLRKFIRQNLDNYKDNNGVIQLTGEEFTGPLHFVKFWLDVIKEWEKEKGKKEIIGLSVNKDVQDSILANPAYVSVVDLIDIRRWHYQADGTVYAPLGGQNLAPRQEERILKPKKTSFEQVYRAVKEYRSKYSGKAILYSGDSFDAFGWAVLMAGGSLPIVPTLPQQLLADISTMLPIDNAADTNQFVLGNAAKGYLGYNEKASAISIDLKNATGNFKVNWINSKTGELTVDSQTVKGGGVVVVNRTEVGGVLWLVKM